MSIYFMTANPKIDKRSKSGRSIFQPPLNQFSNILTCHSAFDEAKK